MLHHCALPVTLKVTNGTAIGVIICWRYWTRFYCASESLRANPSFLVLYFTVLSVSHVNYIKRCVDTLRAYLYASAFIFASNVHRYVQAFSYVQKNVKINKNIKRKGLRNSRYIKFNVRKCTYL